VTSKLGVNIPNFGAGADCETLCRRACLAESLGFASAMISDHVAITSDVQGQYPAPFYDPFLLLAWMAGMTKQIELGTTVTVVPYRHPLETARLAANLDRLSGGRFIFGIGVGWARQEFEALGVPFEHRGAITNEYLEIIRKCWTEELVSHAGRWVSFREVHTAPRPLRIPHPPVWVGGSSDAALRRAVRYGDAWHPIRFRMERLKEEALPKLARFAEEAGRPVPAFCPRLQFQTVDEARAGIDALSALGAQEIVLDTPYPEAHWESLAKHYGY
jgi:probable F420-dependent oxidoreductase